MGRVIRIAIKLVTFLVVLALLYLVSWFAPYVEGTSLFGVFQFIRLNLVILILISLLLLFGDLFDLLPFPLSLPAPVFKASGGGLVVWLAMEALLMFMPQILGVRIILTYLIPLFVFVVILVTEYLKLIRNEKPNDEKLTLEKVREEVQDAIEKALNEKSSREKKKSIKKSRR